MSSFAWGSLYDGQLPNVKTTLFTAGGEVSIMSIKLVTTDTSQHAVNIYLRRSLSTSRHLIPKDVPMHGASLVMAADIEVIDKRPLELSAGDSIEGSADAAGVIDCVISGATR